MRGAGEVGKESERSGIRPVQVVQHEENRAEIGQQRADRFEEQASLHTGIRPARDRRSVLCHRQFGHQPDELALAHDGRVTVLSDGRADRLDKGLVGAEALGCATSPQHRCALERPRELAGEARLAHTGFARDQHDPRPL